MYINCLKDICNGSLNDQVAQVCFVMIESLSHTTDDLIFKWNFTNPLYVSPEIQLPQVKYSKYHWGSQNGLISRHFVSFLTPFFSLFTTKEPMFSWSWSRRRPKTVRSSTAPEPSLAWPPSSRWEETQAQSYRWIIISPFNGGLQHYTLEETFVMSKISGHLLFSTYIPSVLIVTMSWIRSDIERHKKIFLCVLW